MSWLSIFLSENGRAVLTGGVAGLIAWVCTYAMAKPISQIREMRLQALQLAERHAHLRFTLSGEVQSARSAILDVATRMRAFARARPGVTNLYCRCRGYDMEMAFRCLNGLSQMIGSDSFGNEERRNQLDALHYYLNADNHLSRVRRTDIRNMLHEAETEDAA